MMEPDLNNPEQRVQSAYREASRTAPHDEPSATLDGAIRAAARRAVAAKPQAPGKIRYQRWGAPLAAAATVLLTASVIFVTMNEHPESITAPLNDAPDAQTQSQTQATIAAPINPARAALEPRMPKPGRLPEIALTPNERKTEITGSEKIARENNYVASIASLAAPDRREQSPPMLTIAPSAAPALPAPAPSSKLFEAADKATQRARADGAISNTTAIAKSAVPAAPAVVSAPAARSQANADVDAAKALGASAPAPATAATISAASLGKADISEAADIWIMRMLSLQSSGKNNELAEELVRFRKRYPMLILPATLAAEWAKIETENAAKIMPKAP